MFVVMVFVVPSTDHVPKWAVIPFTTALFSSAVPWFTLLTANFGMSDREIMKAYSPLASNMTWFGNDLDDPARRIAGLNFHDGMDQPRDEPSPNRQGCLLAAMLVKAAASRDIWISRLERLHIDQAAARETVPRRHT